MCWDFVGVALFSLQISSEWVLTSVDDSVARKDGQSNQVHRVVPVSSSVHCHALLMTVMLRKVSLGEVCHHVNVMSAFTETEPAVLLLGDISFSTTVIHATLCPEYHHATYDSVSVCVSVCLST